MLRKTNSPLGISMKEVHTSYGNLNLSTANTDFFLKRKTSGIAIKYVSLGQENYTIREQTHALQQGQFMLLRAAEYFEAYNEKRIPSTNGMCINLEVDGSLNYAKILQNDLLFNRPFYGNCSTLFGQHLQQLAIQSQPNFEFAIFQQTKNTLEQLSSTIYHLEKNLSSTTKKKTTLHALIGQLLKAREYIYQNYRQKISLTTLAKVAGISKYYFLRLFKICFQLSPIELVHQLRLKEAEFLIGQQQQRLTDIAYYLGYTDLAAFSTRFKKENGLSPTDFIKRL